MKKILFIAILFLTIGACKKDKPLPLSSGMLITESVTIKKDSFFLDGADSINQATIIIEGDDIVVDFNGAVLIGSTNYTAPHTFSGLGIEIRNGKNITIKNAVVRGFKVGLLATGIEGLKILDSDFSYNYRQKLKSTAAKEDLADWMSYHHNDKDEWFRYGMAIYLRQCDKAVVKNVTITGGQNALMLTGCNHGLFYNNDFSFNSGLGIGMYRSSNNRVMHNRLDWNIRGYSHGIYNRGQDSAGILLYEQCSENTVAYNSATHSGDGFFLWAGQTTIDSGKNGCNNNLVCENDFSYASNNGIEVTFSGHNNFYKNILHECDYGIWGGYSYGMDIASNDFKNNNHGIAIEHGNNTLIRNNQFSKDKIGLKLFERAKQPDSWGFAKKRNVKSRSYTIKNNLIAEINNPFQIEGTDAVEIENNYLYKIVNLPSFIDRISNPKYPSDYLNEDEFLPVEIKDLIPEPLQDGMHPFLKENDLKGRQYMIIGEFGPYNFQYPALWLRAIDGNTFTFAVFGPFGNWKAVGGKGFKMMSQKRGSTPATLVLEAEENAEELSIELEYLGPAFINKFGLPHAKGKPVSLTWTSK